MIGWIIVLVILTAAGIPAGIGISKLNKEHAEARNVSLGGVDFTTLTDGEYTG
ncbi:MAG: FMN-binding protein, partial [Anaerolineae bacterium]|nr:FMN-binding protein [Anaerolineae bacterium]